MVLHAIARLSRTRKRPYKVKAAVVATAEALVAVAVTAAAMVKMEMLAAAETAVGDRFDL